MDEVLKFTDDLKLVIGDLKEYNHAIYISALNKNNLDTYSIYKIDNNGLTLIAEGNAKLTFAPQLNICVVHG